VLNRSKVVVPQLFDDARMGRAIKTQKISSIVNQITALIDADPSVILNMARLKTKDDYKYLHSVSVCALMINLAQTMLLDEPLVREAGMAGLIHDVGKLAIPNEILLKPAKLDDAEFEIVKDHPLVGYRILAASDGISAAAMDVCLHHHGKMDGSGYPDGLNGEELTLLTRMASICDVYDAVTSQRAYNVPWTPSQALARMQSWKGHFDQLILHAFVESLNILPIGTLVRLTGDHLAAVIGETARDYSLPRVRIFYSIGGSKTVPFYDFDTSRSPSCWKIMSVEDPLDWGFDDWHRLCADILAKTPSSLFPRSPSADLESDRPSHFRQPHKV
jgi:HD-GYP domain-containing protein (c-di-GMP phosphodiesterase class II)